MAETRGPTARILIVEDDAAVRESTTLALRDAGWEVLAAPDYRAALAALEDDAPIDLLLTDIVMPNRVNGMALARMARLRRREIKVVYMTAYDIPGADEEAMGPILRKPIESERLVGEIRRALMSSPPPS